MRYDFLGTVLFAVLVILYSAYVALNGLPLLWGTPEMATTGLALGVVSSGVITRTQFLRQPLAIAATLGTIAIGVVAGLAQSDALLAVCMASLISLWLFGLHARAAARARLVHAAPVLGREVSQLRRDTAPKQPAWARDVPSAA
jgi:hypothetical protein